MNIKNTKERFRLKEQRNISIMTVCFIISITCMIIVLSANILLVMNKKEANQTQLTQMIDSKTKD